MCGNFQVETLELFREEFPSVKAFHRKKVKFSVKRKLCSMYQSGSEPFSTAVLNASRRVVRPINALPVLFQFAFLLHFMASFVFFVLKVALSGAFCASTFSESTLEC